MRALLVLAACVLLLNPVPPTSAAEPLPLDVAAAIRALSTTQVHIAPGAVATFDQSVVLPLLGERTKILLAPPRSLDSDSSDDYDQVGGPLRRWARDQDVELILVRGLSVGTPVGTIVATDLEGLREQLAQNDITDLLDFAAHYLEDDDYDDADEEGGPPPTVPADPAQVRDLTAALTRTPTYVAPGVAATLDAAALQERVGDVTLRVAVLPVLPRGAPYPDLVTPLSARFPDDLVVVARGTWFDVVGPAPRKVASARNFVMGQYRTQLTERAVPVGNVLGLFLERYDLLQRGNPFGRPGVDPVSADDVSRRLQPFVAVLVGGGLAAGSLLLGLRGRRALRRRRQERLQVLRHERAELLLRLGRLSTRLMKAPDRYGPAVARAAERHGTALSLLEQAEARRDAEVLAVAAAAVADAEALIAEVEV